MILLYENNKSFKLVLSSILIILISLEIIPLGNLSTYSRSNSNNFFLLLSLIVIYLIEFLMHQIAPLRNCSSSSSGNNILDFKNANHAAITK